LREARFSSGGLSVRLLIMKAEIYLQILAYLLFYFTTVCFCGKECRLIEGVAACRVHC